ncbi:MAG: hypothetical protein LBQ55_01530 [Treponema sp.]|jgi:hypothetical protein|nr:hypothetical protein [Treponema sp.]
MIKYCGPLAVCLFLFSACGIVSPGGKLVSLPEPGIDITIPEGFYEAGTEELAWLRANNAAAAPVPPFRDAPAALFYGLRGESLLVSRLTLIDPSLTWSNPMDSIYEYHRGLETHYDTAIPAEDIAGGNYRLVLLHITFVTEQVKINLDRGLYHYGNDDYLMIDLYSNREDLPKADIKAYDRIFRSLKIR